MQYTGKGKIHPFKINSFIDNMCGIMALEILSTHSARVSHIAGVSYRDECQIKMCFFVVSSSSHRSCGDENTNRPFINIHSTLTIKNIVTVVEEGHT